MNQQETIERVIAKIQDVENCFLLTGSHGHQEKARLSLLAAIADLRALSVGREEQEWCDRNCSSPYFNGSHHPDCPAALALQPEAPVKVDVEGLACLLWEAVEKQKREVGAREEDFSHSMWCAVAQAAYNYTRPVLTEAEWNVVLEALENSPSSEFICDATDEAIYQAAIKRNGAVAAKLKARGR